MLTVHVCCTDKLTLPRAYHGKGVTVHHGTVTSDRPHCAAVAWVTVEELVKFLVSTQILQNVGGVRMVGKHPLLQLYCICLMP